MRIAMVGLGRMGGNMVLRLQRGGHECVVYDPDPAARQRLADAGAAPADDLAAMVAALPTPRTVWVMVPSGRITDETLGRILSDRWRVEAGERLIGMLLADGRLTAPFGAVLLDVDGSGPIRARGIAAKVELVRQLQELVTAVALYAQKGDTTSADRASRRIDELAQTAE